MSAPLIAIWSPKGGVGKSLLAAGLAVAISRRCAGEVLLADLDGGKADLAPLLQAARHPSILEFGGERLRTLAHPSGIRLLPGPVRLTEEALVTGPLVDSVLTAAVASHAAVVADLDSDLREPTAVALSRADAVLLVTTPDLLAIYALRRFVQEAMAEGVDLSPYRLVINRSSEQQGIPEKEILELLEVELAGRLPSLPGLAAAINRGMLSAALRSDTDFARAVDGIADALQFAGIPQQVWSSVPGPRPAGLIQALRRWWRR
ncbi:MAG: AAA family ATPase [Bacillota bacterium]